MYQLCLLSSPVGECLHELILINKFTTTTKTLPPPETMPHVTHSQAILEARGWAWAPGFGRNGGEDTVPGACRPRCELCVTPPFCLPQSVLKKRDQVQAEYEAKLEAVALRKEDRPKVREPPGRAGCLGCTLKSSLEPSGSCPYMGTTEVLGASWAVLLPLPLLLPFSLISGCSSCVLELEFSAVSWN